MTDKQLTLQAMSDAQRILEEYLVPRPHNNERILDKLVEVLERHRRACSRRSPAARWLVKAKKS
jgi:hypothetical protein